MSNPLFSNDEAESTRHLTKCVVLFSTAAVVIVLLITASVVTVRYRDRKSRSPSVTYTQLTADLVDEDHVTIDDDDHLLVG
jgi:hypothetical protein